MLDRLDWLSVQQLVAQHTLVSVFRIRTTNEPEHLANMLNQENIVGHIVMKNTRLGLYRDSFVFRGALLWNRLPKELRKEKSVGKFKKEVKEWVKENVVRFPT